MHKTTLTALALILATTSALAQEMDAEADAAIAANESLTDEIDQSDIILAAEQAGELGTDDLNAAALSVLKDEIPATSGATPEIAAEIDAVVTEAEAMMAEMDAEDEVPATMGATPEAIAEVDAATADAEAVMEDIEAEEVLVEVEAADPGDARVVEMGEDGPTVTDKAAPTPSETAESLDADTDVSATNPVMRDTDTLVVEPLVNRIGIDSGKTIEAETSDVEIVKSKADLEPDKPTNAELNAKLAELDALLEDMEAEQVDQVAAQSLEMEIEAEMDELDAEIDALDALDAEVEAVDSESTAAASDTTTVEIEDTVTMGDDGTKARKTMIIMTDANGNTTITQNAKASIAAIDQMDTAPNATKVKVIVKKLDGAEDKVNIEATGAIVTETVTPDGSTRIIRVAPENGDKGTLITITKD